jgi:hypothetical protein
MTFHHNFWAKLYIRINKGNILHYPDELFASLILLASFNLKLFFLFAFDSYLSFSSVLTLFGEALFENINKLYFTTFNDRIFMDRMQRPPPVKLEKFIRLLKNCEWNFFRFILLVFLGLDWFPYLHQYFNLLLMKSCVF